MTGQGHIPVLLAEAVEALAPRADAVYADATFGGGGYARAILEAAPCTLWALDRDPDAIARGAALAARFPGRLHLVETRFGAMLDALAEHGVTALDGVVMDLGVSSFQLDEAGRGFSFRAEGPLDMRMEKSGPSAADLVNTLEERALAAILADLGEERHARRIARAIIRARSEETISTTARLAEIVRSSVPRDPSGIDSATRSFQALRMAVNDELPEIERGLAAAAALLAPGGRLVVVAFHSLEDRIVKRFMAARTGREGLASRHDPAALMARAAPEFRLLTPRAVRPGEAELARNPRARSAKLRAMERIACSAR
ncbi:16S rRNA (cytosine(1402)-N(4))-methyltransferase RsmH [Plastoroseomonas hellenica]|uniref:Ribosomal RNA small subunit methyltransferase H n=1 Tax=Plastoroseomonas hellenica TaxID=2687306 RepID=A0ABS5F489_9PROT|nr:16S rRNA (cytosine(1402)-N(4))-methyltransferase RsmH [Plastoroseomonas hellenica]MBR0644970.1 16S rRNA (cytosine(1402)-N(4))-methyltransferase RsmH [Plastoroseomonas hellenica]MBR0667362.1 16S rRNA (cytosine(1402)-N(4))-methyltransferase RsmH [Plastoroseomonas hellenica]